MKFKGFGAIFDFDGVIVDTEPLYFQAMQQMAKKRGKVFTLETKKEVMGTGGLLSMKIMKERLSLRETPEELLKERSKIYGRLLERFGFSPRPGLFPTLKLFKEMGFAKAIASSTQRKWIELGLRSLGITQEFKVIVSGEEVAEAKPDPEIFLLTSKRLRIKRGRCLVLEDTITGVRAAKAAGMKCIAIPNQYNRDEDFSRADLTIRSLKEISRRLIEELLLG